MENFTSLPITLQRIHLNKTEKNQEQVTMADTGTGTRELEGYSKRIFTK